MNREQDGFGFIKLLIVLVVAAIVALSGWQVSLAFQHQGIITTTLNDLHIATTSLSATVTGTVTEGPTTPVCIATRPCDKPVANHGLEALDTSGNVAAQTTTAANGSYSLQLAPGQYTLVLVPKLGFTVNGSQLVAVRGAQTHNLSVDTGLR